MTTRLRAGLPTSHGEIFGLEVLWLTNIFALDALAGIARLSELDTTAIDAKRGQYVAKMAKAHRAKGAGGEADSETNV